MIAFIENNLTTIAMVLGILLVLVIIALFSLFKQVKKFERLQRRLDRLVMVDEPIPLGELLKYFNDHVASLELAQKEIREEFSQIQRNFETTVVHTGLVQYDAFDHSGLNLSFSLCLLNKRLDGVIITGLHGGEKALTYGKAVKVGKGVADLSKEEEEALGLALAHTQ